MSYSGSEPEESYQDDLKDDLMLDKPGTIVEPDVRKSLIKYFEDMGLLEAVLHEAAKTPSDLPPQVYVTVEKLSDGVLVYFSDMTGQMDMDGILPGIIEAYDPDESTGPCDGALVIRRAFVTEGFGPLLYDVMMEAAGNRGLTMDRETLTQEAFHVWDYYLHKRSDVKAIPLNDCETHPSLFIYQMEYEEGKSPVDYRYVKTDKSATKKLASMGKLIQF